MSYCIKGYIHGKLISNKLHNNNASMIYKKII